MPAPLIVAHRGYSGSQPEQTAAAYLEAIAWSERTGVPLLLECDVQFSADDQLVCLHDLTLDRTSNGTGPALDHTVTQLRALDFGSWKTPDPSPDQRRLVTLDELLGLVRDARARGVDVELAIETKHPTPRGLDIEERLPELLAPYGWTDPGSPVRLLSFNPAALERMAELLPDLERTFLIEKTFGPWVDGHLPAGAAVAGVGWPLLREDPGYAERLHERGGRLNAWTLNTPEDLDFALGLGAHFLSTDFPDRAVAAIARFDDDGPAE